MKLYVTVTHTLSGLTGSMTFTVKRIGEDYEVTPGVFWSKDSIWPIDVISPLSAMLARQAAIFAALPGRRVFYSASSHIESHWHKL